ncbi:response regulator [bacterium]|nr:response regulator [bacterium]MBU1984563.1 response regulator [bacterium]
MSKILLIDDDPQVNEVVKASLEMIGHAVATAEDPETAVQLCAAVKPDLTLVDYMLPNRSGLELMEDLERVHPDSLRCLATGMADFGLLKKALAAGAGSMLSKPYRLADLADLIELAVLLNQALKLESELPDHDSQRVSLICPADKAVDPAVVATLARFAKTHGADAVVGDRILPLIAVELMRNAATHGSADVPEATYRVELNDADDELNLTVGTSGPEFDWQKALARAQSGMQKGKAGGLQLVLALARRFGYGDGGRVAQVVVGKNLAGES